MQAQPKWAVVDVETTGLEDDCEVIEVAVVHLDFDGEPEETFESLVKPVGLVGAQEIHGITTTELGNAPPFTEVVDELIDWTARRVLVGHNVTFDLSVCARCAREANRTWPALQFVDTKVLAGRAGYKAATLQELVASVGLELKVAHRALPDALVTARVFQRLMHDVGACGVELSGG